MKLSWKSGNICEKGNRHLKKKKKKKETKIDYWLRLIEIIFIFPPF